MLGALVGDNQQSRPGDKVDAGRSRRDPAEWGVVMWFAWWRRHKDGLVSRKQALRALRGIRKQERGLGNTMSRNDGYDTPDRSTGNGAGGIGGWTPH
jgi:hypothetical protein